MARRMDFDWPHPAFFFDPKVESDGAALRALDRAANEIRFNVAYGRRDEKEHTQQREYRCREITSSLRDARVHANELKNKKNRAVSAKILSYLRAEAASFCPRKKR